jgi:hypothetical protein
MWGEVKGCWRVVMKRPKVQGSEKWGVKHGKVQWSDVKWSEVMMFGEMYVLSLIYSYVAVCMFCAVRCVVSLLFAAICYSIYSYVAVCRFCAVRCVIIICCYLLYSNYVTNVFLIFCLCLFFCFVLYFVYSVLLYCFVYCFSFCVVCFLFLYNSTDHFH